MDWVDTWKETTIKEGTGISAFHIHTKCELLYVTEGIVEMKISGKTYTITPGNLVVIGVLEVHDLVPKTYPYSRVGIHIDCNMLNRYGIPLLLSSIFMNRPREWCHVFDISNACEIADIIKRIYKENNMANKLKDEMQGVLIHQLLMCLYRLYPERFFLVSDNDDIEQAKRYIEKHYADFNSVQHLASRYYLTPSHFIAKFKKHTGYTPYKYRNLFRIFQARCMLLNDDSTLMQIAENCGFSDTNSFVRAFREVMKITPGQFRKISKFSTEKLQ